MQHMRMIFRSAQHMMPTARSWLHLPALELPELTGRHVIVDLQNLQSKKTTRQAPCERIASRSTLLPVFFGRGRNLVAYPMSLIVLDDVCKS